MLPTLILGVAIHTVRTRNSVQTTAPNRGVRWLEEAEQEIVQLVSLGLPQTVISEAFTQ